MLLLTTTTTQIMLPDDDAVGRPRFKDGCDFAFGWRNDVINPFVLTNTPVSSSNRSGLTAIIATSILVRSVVVVVVVVILLLSLRRNSTPTACFG